VTKTHVHFRRNIETAITLDDTVVETARSHETKYCPPDDVQKRSTSVYLYILYLYIQNIHVYGPLIIMLYTRAYYNDDVQKTIIILYRFNSVRPRPVLYVFLKLLLIEIYSARMKIN